MENKMNTTDRPLRMSIDMYNTCKRKSLLTSLPTSSSDTFSNSLLSADVYITYNEHTPAMNKPISNKDYTEIMRLLSQ